MQICPSILETTSAGFVSQLKKLSSYFNYFQIDVADGKLVNNKTISIEEIITAINNQLLIVNNLTFDFHLMVKYYEKEITRLRDWKSRKLGKIGYVFIHASLLPNHQLLTTNYPFPIGLVLNPEDQVSLFAKKYNLNQIAAIQIMSVNPGQQGGSFIPKTLKKIEQLRLLGYGSKIFLDGGINNQTLPFILNQKYLPDVLCPGSFLTRAANLQKNVDFLKQSIISKEKTSLTNSVF